ncbi:hypothetical protein NIES2100_14760 [Calothrix sp. NIES-2100]|uniref:two-partner secretion domain-containing protein n=1 Tax=Calothrix sp. NIES-2100 TaxID=1954172 RepID=UPI000B612355|nr:hypothetical protein NIES2100_14760 [Calothrix sp. NIES-2100]
MVPSNRQKLWQLLAIASLMTALTNSAQAQILPDSTLGAETTKLTPNANVQGLPTTLIEGGATRGVNLFHSFLQFNVGEGQRVYFANPAGIENILTRVTGNDPSKIFGTLGVDGTANLFFLNPNGIIFGANARLDVAGSFLATTANSFVFDNGLKFSATNPEAAPLLIVSLHPGLQFAANQSRSISNSGNLIVGQDLTLVGGNLDLQGKLQAGRNLTLQATDTVKLRDTAVNPLIVKAGEKLILQGNHNIDIFALNHPQSGLFSGADMVLRSNNTVAGDAQYWAGGNFRIEKLDGNLGNLFSPNDPIIRASGDVNFNSYEGASLHIFAGGSVEITGDVTITSTDTQDNSIQETVNNLFDTNIVNTVNIDGSNQATLDIRAGTQAIGIPLGLTGQATPTELALGNTPTSANITVDGNVSIQPVNGLVFLTNQYQANSLPGQITLNGQITGASNSTIINSRGDITVNKYINSGSYKGFTGNAGDITLIADNSLLVKDGELSSASFGDGDAGSVNIYAGKSVTFHNSSVFSTVENGSRGNGKDINITTGNLSVIAEGDGYSSLQTLIRQGGNGDAGSVNINAAENVLFISNSNSQFATGVFSIVENGAPGNAGNININTGTLTIDRANLQSKNQNTGLAGEISIYAREQVLIQNKSFIISTSNNNANEGFGLIQIGGFKDSSDKLFLPQKVIIDNSILSTTNTGTQQAGDIVINAHDLVEIKNQSQISSQGNFGRILFGKSEEYSPTYSPKEIRISDNSHLSTNNSGIVDGNNQPIDAGGIFIDTGILTVSNSFLESRTTRLGNAGDIEITAASLFLTNGAYIDNSTSGDGNAGNININVIGKVSLDGVYVFQDFLQPSAIYSNVESGGNGNAGNINITAASLSLTNGATIDNSTFGTGNAGNIKINVTEQVSLDGFKIIDDKITPSAIYSNVESGGEGNAGNIEIKAASLFLTNGAEINNSTLAVGNAGNININVTEQVRLDGFHALKDNFNVLTDYIQPSAIHSNVESGGEGNAGNIDIKAASLFLTNGGQIDNSTLGTGNAGNISIDVTDIVSLDSLGTLGRQMLPSTIASTVGATNYNEKPQGNGGNIYITAGSLSLKNGSHINNSIENSKPIGNIKAGDVILNVQGPITLDGFIDLNGEIFLSSAIYSRVESQGHGDSGNILIENANSLSLSNGASLDVSIRGKGNAGTISVNVNDLISVDNFSTISTSVNQGIGKGGEITINANKFIALNGGQVLTNTTNGDAGKIKFNITDSLKLSGSYPVLQVPEKLQDVLSLIAVGENNNKIYPSGLFANTEIGSIGKGGSIDIDPNLVMVTDGARISVDSNGNGDAGNILLQSDRLILQNAAAITADTSTGKGGGIELNVQDLLLLRNQSHISTSAGQQGAGGDGGQITINAQNGFLVSPVLENSDITANAFGGRGGRIEINAKGVIGLATLTRQEIEQKLGTIDPETLKPQFLETNDITAISQTDPQLNGIVSISSPDIDPSKGIISLPTNTTDPSKQIAQNCDAVNEKENSAFTDTGRGGLPHNPDEFVRSEPVWEDIRLRANTPQQSNSAPTTNLTSSKQKTVLIMPATGWVFNNKGEVTLISQTPQSSATWFNSSSCAAR